MDIINIRFATKEDLDAISEIERKEFPKEEAATQQQFYDRFLLFPESFLIAEVDGKIVGFINGCCTNNNKITDDLFEDANKHDPNGSYQSVFGIAVLNEYQGKGIAKKLMGEFIKISKQRNKKGIILTCKDKLIPFYEKLGYLNLGISESVHGNVKWNDMIMEFDSN